MQFDRNDFCFWQVSKPIVLHVNMHFCQRGRTQVANCGSSHLVLASVQQCLDSGTPSHVLLALCWASHVPALKCPKHRSSAWGQLRWVGWRFCRCPQPCSPSAAPVPSRRRELMADVSICALSHLGHRKRAGLCFCHLVCHKDPCSLIKQTTAASRKRDFVFLK